MNEGQELVETPEAPVDLFAAYSDPLAELEEKNDKVKFDITTYEGETKCKEYIAKIGKFRIGVEALRKSLKQEFLDGGRAVDKKAKSYQERIAAIDAVHSVPLKELENKRIAEVLEKREKEQAELQRVQDEKDIELEKLRKIVADQEAVQKEKDEAAQAVLDAAEREKEVEAGKLKAAENAIAVEKKRVSDLYEKEQAEQRKIDADILARQQDVEHRKKINNVAVDALDALVTQSTELSIAIITEIAKGNIPGVGMIY